jgi:hypothetical protein
MKIPLIYAIKFWIKNSMLSTATGAVVGMLIWFGILGAIPSAIIGFIAKTAGSSFLTESNEE